MMLLADLAIRSCLIVAAGLLATAVLRRRSAAVRHGVLAMAVFASAAVVPLAVLLPAWRLPVSTAGIAPAPQLSAVAEPLVAQGTSVADAPRRAALVPPPVLATVWAAGGLLCLALLAGGLRTIVRTTRRAPAVQDDRWKQIAAQVSATYGLKRPPRILQTRRSDVLATWGVFRPIVVVPAHARLWSDERVHVVLCHELAHIRRHDWSVQMVAELLRACFWFNPLLWIACTRLRRESEHACDDAVLERGVPPGVYAAHLLEIARMCRRQGTAWAAAMPMSRPSTLERRITAMLNPHLDRRQPTRRTVLVTAAVLCALALPAAALRGAQNGPLPLTGSIYDPTGAVLPQVALTLEEGQAAISATTDAEGRFEFPSVRPGRYLLQATLPGFRPLYQEVELAHARDWDRAITLQVGELRETVSVSERRVAPPAEAEGPRRVRVGGNIRAPRKAHDVFPVYPPAMRAAGREGVVPVEAVIGVDGLVHSSRVLSSQVHPDFAMAALDAVRQWRFAPTLLNGDPVEVRITVSVEFSLMD